MPTKYKRHCNHCGQYYERPSQFYCSQACYFTYRKQKARESDNKRFWSKVLVGDVDKCWEWKPNTNANPYGRFVMGGKEMGAHRAAWLFAYGKIGSNLCVLHKCDNTICVNPKHLFLGTYADNIRDCIQKGRWVERTGELNPYARLTDDQVQQMRQLFNSGKLIKDIAAMFGCSQSNAGNIVNHRAWKHLK